MLQPKLISVTAADVSHLRLVYETGEVKLFDVSPYIRGSWYGELRDPDYFRTVHLIDDGAGIAWAHGQDLAPHELYELSVTVSGNEKPFDYTEWQRDYFDRMPPETIREKALAYAEKHPYNGDPVKRL